MPAAPTVDVVITLRGVRAEHLPRLKTAVKSYMTRFGRSWDLAEKAPEPQKPKAGKGRKRS